MLCVRARHSFLLQEYGQLFQHFADNARRSLGR